MQSACQRCRRLIGAGCLPERAGQPAQIQLHMTLDQLRGLPGAGDAEAAWWAARGPAAPPGSDCDASVVPLVSGHVDPAVLDKLATARRGPAAGPRFPGIPRPPGRALTAAALPAALLRHAADLLSGPAGLAAYLRTGLLDGAAGAVSLPLDIGRATEQIPAHLRRAVIARDRQCRFPGCDQPPAACHVHHICPRREGGRTGLTNLILLCAFHHLIAVHRWGWAITLSLDGTVTALSPDQQRTLHSHGPPARAA
jgi:HNH endonuclease